MMLLQQHNKKMIKCDDISRKRRKIDRTSSIALMLGVTAHRILLEYVQTMKLWLFVFVAYTAFIQCLCKCEIERSDVTECLFLKADFNGDSRISKEELNKGVKIHLSYMARLFLSQIGL